MFNDKTKTFLFYLKYNLTNKNARSSYKALLKNQHLSGDELESLSWEKRKKLLYYAYENVPYYKNKFDECHFHPNDITLPEHYSNVPLLTKDDLRQNFNNMQSAEAKMKYLKLSTTGGSTGVPTKVYFDKRVHLDAFGWRLMDWWGVTPGMDNAVIWRQRKLSKIELMLIYLAWWPTSRIKLNASSMNQKAITDFVKKFNTVRPKLLFGYVGAVDHLASFIEENSMHIHSPTAIWVTSAPISEVQRQRMERVFGAPVYDQYGCSEVLWLAAQCKERKGLHIFADTRHIEFIDENDQSCPTGQQGKIVVTDLENYVFPIIRYVNGDVGRLQQEKCTCGLNFPLMDSVKGRITDVIRLPNSTTIAGDYLTTIFDDFPDAVKAFQVRQKKDYSINVVYVPNHDYGQLEDALQKVHRELVRVSENQVTISLEPVEAIAHDRGKLRFVMSDLN